MNILIDRISLKYLVVNFDINYSKILYIKITYKKKLQLSNERFSVLYRSKTKAINAA